MKILAVGGGSGGHVTPVVAVLREIKILEPSANVRFWCDKKFFKQARDIMNNFDKKIVTQTILSGKFRRYYNMSIVRQLITPSIVIPNIYDGFMAGLGFLQSIVKLIIWRPDVIFTKGGYVCLPVGIAAKVLGIKLVIHDSDAHPGLTNRVLGKWADAIATGAPLEYYNYPASKARYVGVPISSEFYEFSDKEQSIAKKKWGVNTKKPLIVVTGGGLGAARINDAVSIVLHDLIMIGSVVLISGDYQYEKLRSVMPKNSEDFQLYSFISHDIASLLGAADVVVARAGATSILELAALVKPTILIPNAHLTGGHQSKNAAVYAKKNAVKVIDEEKMLKNPQILVSAIKELLQDPIRAHNMAKSLSTFSRPDAATDVAKMIINEASR